MRVLLDTNVVIWAMIDGSRLPSPARRMISDASKVFVSAATIWEIAIKVGLGKLDLDMDDLFESLTGAGAERLPVTWDHARAVRALPPYHRDPFDRMLVAQAQSEALNLLTGDELLGRYGSFVSVI